MLLTKIVFLKYINCLPKTSLWDLHDLPEKVLALLPTNLLFWQACSTYTLPPKPPGLYVFATVLIFHYLYLKMFRAFYRAPIRNGTLLLQMAQNYYMPLVKQPFPASPLSPVKL